MTFDGISGRIEIFENEINRTPLPKYKSTQKRASDFTKDLFLKDKALRTEKGLVRILKDEGEILDAFKLRYNEYQKTEFAEIFRNRDETMSSEIDTQSILIGFYPHNSTTLGGTLAMHLRDTNNRVKSEIKDPNIFIPHSKKETLAELHGLAIGDECRRVAFKPLFEYISYLGFSQKIDSYILTMRSDLTKLYRKFQNIQTYMKLSSHMGIDVENTILLWRPTHSIYRNLTIH